MPEAKWVEQAGAIVYRRQHATVHILVVEARTSPGDWIFPKGRLTPGESLEAAALRDVREEAGVEAALVLPLGALQFRSATEAIRVHYVLARQVADTQAADPPAVCWLPVEEALTKLTDKRARQLLRGALAFIADDIARLDEPSAASSSQREDRFVDLMLADFGQTAESLLRNEEDGEKRASFFVAIAAGAGGVLTFALGSRAQIGPAEVHPLVALMLLVVVVMGYFTLVRLAHRNRVTDGYKQGLHRVRRYFLTGPGDTRRAFMAFDPYQLPRRQSPSWRSIGRGGWLETVAAVESLLSGALVAILVPTRSWWSDAGIGAVVAVLVWIALMRRAGAVASDEEPARTSVRR